MGNYGNMRQAVVSRSSGIEEEAFVVQKPQEITSIDVRFRDLWLRARDERDEEATCALAASARTIRCGAAAHAPAH
jgi:hypothetical protein